VEQPFDLVLLDIMMPRMSGMDVLKFLRRVDSLIDLPIIIVTAKEESEDMVEALERGTNDYNTKPLDFPVVLARIRTQLELRRAVSQVKELEQKLAARNKKSEAGAKKHSATNEQMTGDLHAAARVQRALLPAFPPRVPGARFAWTIKPCGSLAGNFLNIFRFR
jgi:DNA-binding response OmpR family regulator